MKRIYKDEILRNSVGLMLSFGAAVLIFSLLLEMVTDFQYGYLFYFTLLIFVVDLLVVTFQYRKLVLYLDLVE